MSDDGLLVASDPELAAKCYPSGTKKEATAMCLCGAVEIKLKGVVMISSPGLMPKAINEISKASVPLETVIQLLTPTKLESFFSNSKTSGPKIY